MKTNTAPNVNGRNTDQSVDSHANTSPTMPDINPPADKCLPAKSPPVLDGCISVDTYTNASIGNGVEVRKIQAPPETAPPEHPEPLRPGSVRSKKQAVANFIGAAGQPQLRTISETTVPAQMPELVNLASLIQRPPFSTLLKVDPDLLAAIQEDMGGNGADPSHPIHVWVDEDRYTLIDGYTRVTAATALNILYLPAFIHRFKDETAALGFAVRCQINRRNIKDSEFIALVKVYDEKIKPGSTQEREGGKFEPKASTDAVGKSATVTAKALGTSTTKIERARRVIEKAGPAILAKVINDKMTIYAAVGEIQKLEKSAAKSPKTKPEKGGIAPFEPLASEMTFAVWNVLQSAAPAPVVNGTVHMPAPVSVIAGQLDIDFKKSEIKRIGAEFGHRRVLVSPGDDMFSPDVPVSVIREILKATQTAKDFEFLFTTRNPARLAEFSWARNTFAGASVFEQRDVDDAEEALVELKAERKWILVEQLTMELKFKHLADVDWLVVRNRSDLAKAAPTVEAMERLLQLAWAAECPVFFDLGNSFRPVDPPRSIPSPAPPTVTPPVTPSSPPAVPAGTQGVVK